LKTDEQTSEITMGLRRTVSNRTDTKGFVGQRIDGAGQAVAGSGFFSHNFASAPDVNGSAVEAGGFARGLPGTPKCMANGKCEFVARFRARFQFQCFLCAQFVA
jgi:hypothetical protein